MKWIALEGKIRLKMKFAAPWEGASSLAGMQRISRDVGKDCMRAERIGSTGDRGEVFVDKTYENDVEMEYRLNELWKDMERFEDWERISYSLDRV
jgi:hypothetical protein